MADETTKRGPYGDLTIRVEYSCGCRVYRDARGDEYPERGLLCDGAGEHGRIVVEGAQAQPSLF